MTWVELDGRAVSKETTAHGADLVTDPAGVPYCRLQYDQELELIVPEDGSTATERRVFVTLLTAGELKDFIAALEGVRSQMVPARAAKRNGGYI